MVSGTFTGKLRLEYVDGRNWQLIQNPRNRFAFITKAGDICPPDGFMTDFASIPRLFWRILPPVGDGPHAEYGPAAVIHDWLYRTARIGATEIPRKLADDIFLAAMTVKGVGKVRRNLMYWAVRTFAGFAWKGKK